MRGQAFIGWREGGGILSDYYEDSVAEEPGYRHAVALLPSELRAAARALDPQLRRKAEEFRLRVGQLPTVLLPDGEATLADAEPVTPTALRMVLQLATGASAHAYADSLRQGFITSRGGVRVGLCGQAVMGAGEVRDVKHLSSVSLRIPREIFGCADGLVAPDKSFVSTLIISPPGGGKTTLLRDMLRRLSDDGLRVALADERGEVAGVWEGEPQFDVGIHTDVLTGAPKAEAALMLLRAMNPQLLALDEITAPEDVRACLLAANCGVQLLATAHGDGTEDLAKRPLYRELMGQDVFRRAVIIGGRGSTRSYAVQRLGDGGAVIC